MAQIIKQRRGSITQLKDVTARISELVVATGSIGNLNGPFLFVGETEGVAGAYRPISKIYQGSAAPTITIGSYGSILDGTPFYASADKSLYILSQAGNSRMDFTGNIEGNTISNVTITSLTGSNANYTNLTGNTFTSTNGNITSLTGSNANVTNITGSTISGSNVRVTSDMSVGGKVTVTGDISGSNLNLTGNATIDGDIVLKGNISIGNQTTDLVTFGADVSSSILPDVHNAFDLGSSSQNWRNLHVSGTGYIQTLQVNQVTVTNIDVTGDLRVSGSTFLGNGGDITVVSGSLYNDQLTDNRVVIAGVNGLLEDDANFTFDGTKLNIGGGDFEVDSATGNIRTSGSLLVTTTSELKGAVTANSTLTVTGSATFKNNVNVSGDTSTTGSSYVNTNLFVGGNGKVTGSFEVVGATSLDSTLIVTGSSTLKSTLEVQGATNLNSTLTVTGSSTFKNNVDVIGILTVTGETRLQSNLYVSGNLEVLGTSTNVNIQSQTVEIDDNIIRLNAYSPFQRYAGFEVMDSGSSGVSASMLWDSQNDYWIVTNQNGSGSKFVGTTFGAQGSEVNLTSGTFPIATSNNTIGDSLLTDNATTLSYNTNKFQVTASDGATLIAGNVTVSSAGGSDSGTKTSRVVFRNSSNVLGYVSATESTDVLDGILGYKNSDGALKFSTLIDGGTY
jgi:predicted acyltransferase (DUF342 family)